MKLLPVFLRLTLALWLPFTLITGGIADSITPCFTPQENCTRTIVDVLDNAQGEILVQAYSFTSREIAYALLEAQKRGVVVRILLDKSQQSDKHSKSMDLTKAGAEVKIDHVPGIAHNKVMIVDQKTLITGSFNFTHAAQHRNSENVLVVESPELAQRYRHNWFLRARKARPYMVKSSMEPSSNFKKAHKSQKHHVSHKKPLAKHVKAMKALLKKVKG